MDSGQWRFAFRPLSSFPSLPKFASSVSGRRGHPRLPCSERSRSAQGTAGPPLRPSVRPSVGGARWALRMRSQTETRRAACETRRRGTGRRLWTRRAPCPEFNVSRTGTEPVGRPEDPRRDTGGDRARARACRRAPEVEGSGWHAAPDTAPGAPLSRPISQGRARWRRWGLSASRVLTVMGCERIRFQRHPTRSFESETLRGTRSWLGGGVRPSASERAQRPTESSRPVALNALPQTERRADKYAGNGVPSACCASSGSEDHALPGPMDDSPRSDASEMRSPPASRERATREAKTCVLGTAKPEDDCRTPKGPFPAVVRISSGRFTFFQNRVCRYWFLRHWQRRN